MILCKESLVIIVTGALMSLSLGLWPSTIASATIVHWYKGSSHSETHVSRSQALADQQRKIQLILTRTTLLWTSDVKSDEKLTTLTTAYLLSQPDHPLFIANTITADNTITSSVTICYLVTQFQFPSMRGYEDGYLARRGPPGSSLYSRFTAE